MERTTIPQWEVADAPAGGRRVAELLAVGWEPFAVTQPYTGGPTVWLRRPTGVVLYGTERVRPA